MIVGGVSTGKCKRCKREALLDEEGLCDDCPAGTDNNNEEAGDADQEDEKR